LAGAGPDLLDLTAWLRKEGALNGLQSTELRPWHIVVTYDQFDEDGDDVNSGVYEEFWAGPKKYRRSYKSDSFKQTDYATDKGLFRGGDQRWPNRAESQVRAEVTEPFYYGATLPGQGALAGSAERTFSKNVGVAGGFGAFRARSAERTFNGYTLQCVLIEKESQIVSDPTQYCFEPDGSVLRYSRGIGWNQTSHSEPSRMANIASRATFFCWDGDCNRKGRARSERPPSVRPSGGLQDMRASCATMGVSALSRARQTS
jgi:hypothetical protein